MIAGQAPFVCLIFYFPLTDRAEDIYEKKGTKVIFL